MYRKFSLEIKGILVEKYCGDHVESCANVFAYMQEIHYAICNKFLLETENFSRNFFFSTLIWVLVLYHVVRKYYQGR